MRNSIGKSYADLDTFAQGRTCLGKLGTSPGQRFRVLLALSFAVLILSCDYETGSGGERAGPPGVVGLQINLGRAGALDKTATGDTNFNLDSLKVILTATGQTTQTYAYAISGNAAANNVVVTTKYYTVASLITWKAKILSIDTTSNPNHTDTVHIDSVTFHVNPADTTFVSLTFNSSYSILKERIFDNSPDSTIYGVRYVRFRVDGTMRDSSELGAGFNACFFTSATVGWAVGNFGVILKTSNGGTNWAAQTSGTKQNLNSIYMASSTVGWAVGDSGTILKTANGSTWTAQTSGTAQNLNSVSAPGTSTTIAWAVGEAGVIRHTNDGGTNWLAKTSGTTQNLNSVTTITGSSPLTMLAWAAGDSGKILKTMDSTNWTSKTSGTTQNLNSIYMTTVTVLWVAGNAGTLRKSRDSSTWTGRTSNTTQNLNSISIQSATGLGIAAGNSGIIIKTTDSSTWSVQTSNTTQNLNSIKFSGASNAWAVGTGAPVMVGTGSNITTWTVNKIGARGFDAMLAYKYLIPGVNHTILVQAIDTTTGTLRGFETTTSINIPIGRDSTLSTALLGRCGYGGGTPACTP